MRVSEAKKASYFLASFLTSFLFLLSLNIPFVNRQVRAPADYSLLQIVNRHVLKLNLLGTIDVGGISENANGHPGAGNIGEPRIVRKSLMP